MPTLNDLAWSQYSANSGTTGTLNDVTVAYLQQVTGLTTNDINDLWHAQMVSLGYTGQINDMQFEYWGDLGYTGSWNDRYFAWLSDGGAFGANVVINPQGSVPTVGFCDYAPAANCTATRQYVAVDSGFTNPANQWVWSIEPPVAGVAITLGQGTNTVTVETQNLDTDTTFNLKVVATDTVSTDTAERISAQTHYHREDLAVLDIVEDVAGSCNYNSGLGQSGCISQAQYSATITGTPTSYQWTLSDITGGTAQFVGSSTDPTCTVQTTGGIPSVSYKLSLDLTSQFQTGQRSEDFTQTKTDDVVAPVWIGPDLVDPAPIAQGETFPPLDVSGRYSGYVETYSLEGPWPADLTISNAGVITGTVTDPDGNYVGCFVRATNNGGSADSNTITITVGTGVAPAWGVIPDQEFINGDPVNIAMANHLTAGTFPMTFTIIAGALPSGVTLDTNSGVLSGTPTVNTTGSYTIRAQNASGSDDAVVNWEVADNFIEFWALTPNSQMDNLVQEVREGTGVLTTTHTATVYSLDHLGIYRPAAANQPAWHESRPVLNVVRSPDFTIGAASGWTVFNATDEGVQAGVGPDGEDAWQIRLSASATTGIYDTNNPLLNQGLGDYTSRLLCRVAPGDGSMEIRVLGTSGSLTGNITIDDTKWWDVGRLQANTTPTTQTSVYFANADGKAVQLIKLQTEFNVPNGIPNNWHLDNRLHAYSSTQGNTTTPNGGGFNVVSADGAPLVNNSYLQYYPAATNVVQYSNDLTQSARWAAAVGCVLTQNQVGLNGLPNTATLVDDTSGSVAADVRQFPVAQPTTRFTCKFWINKTGTSTWCELQVRWTSSPLRRYAFGLELTTGNTAVRINDIDSAAHEVIDNGDWWLVVVEVADAQTAATEIYIYPSPTANGTTFDPALTGAITVGNVEQHLDKTIEEVRGLGPIFTLAASTATDETVYEFDPVNLTNNKAIYHETVQQYDNTTAPSATYAQPLSTRADDARGFKIQSIVNRFDVVPDTVTSRITYAPTEGELLKWGGSFCQNDVLFSSNLLGTWDTDKDFTNGWTAGQGNLRCMADLPTRFREFRYYDITTYAEGKAIIDGLMP